MAIDPIKDEVLEGATMLHDLFANDAEPAIQRRIAWALDCQRIDEAMYWLGVREAMYGQPL
ncbi:hypothetical protein Q4F19_16420 [Sphingomonas sp. BIUV-7]|uniref:Uncharacterized protein n=1 Tax=Sphingomonas natans TaxID=3063330 RepID=A0ABT8YCC2_9SPHN|nr:hypothetical protein [Sphingomonas sp. BIUV-7]MDO6415976.1 hypothetical protein [Sphingomonas sp. BIUV-7]